MLVTFLEATQMPVSGNIGARQAGINKKVKSRNSATPGNNRGKAAKHRIGCPACAYKGGDPVYVNVGSQAKRAKCPAGHYFRAEGKTIGQHETLLLNPVEIAK